MRKIVLLSVIASAMLMAGGDIQEPEVIEEVMEEVEVPEEIEVEEVEEEEEEMVEAVESDSIGIYFGVAGSALMIKGTDLADITGVKNVDLDDFDEMPITAMAQVGYKINDYIALEGRYWTNLITKLSVTNSSNKDFELAHSAMGGVYLKPMYPVLDSLDIYGLLGYAMGNIPENSVRLQDDNGFSDGLSFGGGASYDIYEGLGIFADYVMFDSSAHVDTSAINVGMNYTF